MQLRQLAAACSPILQFFNSSHNTMIAQSPSTHHFLLISTLALSSVLPARADWDNYGHCAHDTLAYQLPDCATSNSTTGSRQNNECLCTNRAYIQAVARGIKCYCQCDILVSTAEQLNIDCNLTSTPAVYDVPQIIAFGLAYTCGGSDPSCSSTSIAYSGIGGVTPTSAMPTDARSPTTSTTGSSSSGAPTISATQTPSSEGDKGFAGWKPAVIGSLVGGFVAAIGIFLLWRHNRETRRIQRQQAEYARIALERQGASAG